VRYSASSIHTLPLHFGKSISGSHGGEAVPQEDIPRYHRLYRHGILQLDSLITHRYSLDRINDAIADMRSGETDGRCLIVME
jgi:S-(hydroxymethyl)glutathione dehydrogenase / alcohol dehydrogenase